MNSIYKGDLTTRAGRRLAWIDALFIDHAVFRLVRPNFQVVVPGALFRAAHPTPGQLAAFTRRHRLRTLINLRGPARNGADALSRDMAARLGLDFHDMALESRGAPHRDRILRLAGLYRHMHRPALIHCKSGADRAGLAAGLFVLIEGGTASDALAQLSWRYGHVAASKTGILDAFFRLFQRDAEGRKPFLDWVREDYDEAALRRDFRPHALLGGMAAFLNDRLLRRE